MGQKINPIVFRTGVTIPWKSRWFADKNFSDFLLEDIKIRKVLMQKLKLAGITGVEIERLPKSTVINITVSRPGMVIGRGGSGLEDVRKMIVGAIGTSKTGIGKTKLDISVHEVKKPDLSARLVLDRIVSDMERRLPHRRVIAKSIEKVMASGALGIKVVVAGRINGADIARREKYQNGSVPSQTIRERIDYAQSAALLKRGYVGLKVYIHLPAED